MLSKSRIISVMLFGAMLAGCDRPSTSTSAPPPPSATVAVVPDITPVTPTMATQPSGSTLMIDTVPVNFPRARLRLQKRDGHVLALLFSDDPKEAIQDSYTGNSYRLEMPLDADDTSHVAGLDWTFKAASQNRFETQNGIFLGGGKVELIPYDVHVYFTSEGSGMICRIDGQFLQFADAQSTVGKPQSVSGHLAAQVEIK